MKRGICKIVAIGLLGLLWVSHATSSEKRFPDVVAESVVSLGLQDSLGNWSSKGTGFLMYNYERSRHVLVTCRHIVQPELRRGVTMKLPDIWAKADLKLGVADLFGKVEGSWATFHIALVRNDTTLWTGHPDDSVDIAVIDFPPEDTAHNVLGRLSDIKYIAKSDCGGLDSLCLAQDILFVGFPLGLGDLGSPQPLVRSGVISYLDPVRKVFLLDAQVFGGSSGSPVVSTGTARGDPPKMKSRKLLGIVSSFKPSPIRIGLVEKDVTSATKDTVRIAVENAGLGLVYSVDLIQETIDVHNARFHDAATDSSQVAEPAN